MAKETEVSRPRLVSLWGGRELAIERPVDNGGIQLHYSKGLPHDARGDVDDTAYLSLLDALERRSPEAFEDITIAPGGQRLINPQAGLALSPAQIDVALTGGPPPEAASAEFGGEVVELYWMASMRDVPFASWPTNPIAAAAAGELTDIVDYCGPRDRDGVVSPATLFRGFTGGDRIGPYLSQFLLRSPLSLLVGPQGPRSRRRRIGASDARGPVDFLTQWEDWLASRNGRILADPGRFVCRYLSDQRGLLRLVEGQPSCVPLLAVACQLAELNINHALDEAGNSYKRSRNQVGDATLGVAHLLGLLSEAGLTAQRTVSYQKWFVHRRMRPEEFGGLLERASLSSLRSSSLADLDSALQAIAGSAAVERTISAYGTALLPQAYPQGCPLSPSFGSGWAAVVGAGVTILKAWFDENFVLPRPTLPSVDGERAPRLAGTSIEPLTVGNELNKLASNLALARVMAGVSYRSDVSEALLLGERVAIRLIARETAAVNERPTFSLTRFDGSQVIVQDGRATVVS